jgi:hypothetical protein
MSQVPIIPSRQRRAKTSLSKRFGFSISAMRVEPLEPRPKPRGPGFLVPPGDPVRRHGPFDLPVEIEVTPDSEPRMARQAGAIQPVEVRPK